jgi:diphthine-ammonia ligase
MLYSGGKDSTYSISRLQSRGFDVVCLITVISQNKESYMLHTPNIELTKLSAQALSLPLVLGYSKGKKEEELDDIQQTILKARELYGIEAIGTGAIASSYQKNRIDSLGSKCGLGVFSPIWQMDQRHYMRKLISNSYKFVLTSVSCGGLDQSWLGRELCEEDLEKLEFLSSKFKFNIAFEGGEAETFVLDCPLFKQKRIRILDSTLDWNGYFGSLNVLRAILESKESRGKGV